MAWINEQNWDATKIANHEIVTGKEELNAVIGTLDYPSLIVDGTPVNWIRRIRRQHDTVVHSEFRGLTHTSANKLIAMAGMNAITNDPDGRVTHKSEAGHSRANEANGFTVLRTVTDTTYSFTETPL